MTRRLPKSKRTVKRSKKQPSFFDGLFKTISVVILSFSLLLVLIGMLELFIYVKFVETMRAQNIVLASPDAEDTQTPVVVLHITATASPQANRKGIEVIALSAQMPVDVIGGYGEYKLGSVLPLLSLDKKDAQTIRSSFAFGLNLGINQVWKDGALSQDVNQTEIKQLGWRLVTRQVKTGLSPWQQFHWGVFLLRTPDTDITLKQVSSHESWDQAKEWWSLGKLLHVCPVAIVNTTQTSRLGARVSEVLEATGLNIIRVASDQKEVERTTIITDGSAEERGVACNQVLETIEDFIPHQRPVEIDAQKTQQQRADVVIQLGKDMQDF